MLNLIQQAMNVENIRSCMYGTVPLLGVECVNFNAKL